MINVNTRQGRAAALILLLGLGLLIALAPFASGLLAAPVLYVIFSPVYARLAKRFRPSVAAGVRCFFKPASEARASWTCWRGSSCRGSVEKVKSRVHRAEGKE